MKKLGRITIFVCVRVPYIIQRKRKKKKEGKEGKKKKKEKKKR